VKQLHGLALSGEARDKRVGEVTMTRKRFLSSVATAVCLSVIVTVPGLAQPTQPVPGEVSWHHQMMYKMMSDMTQEMSRMTEGMSRSERTPEQKKQMAQRMTRMATLMQRMSGLAGRPSMGDAQSQKQMEQMRKQMDEMMRDSGMTSGKR
jgi:hypothetical protein